METSFCRRQQASATFLEKTGTHGHLLPNPSHSNQNLMIHQNQNNTVHDHSNTSSARSSGFAVAANGYPSSSCINSEEAIVNSSFLLNSQNSVEKENLNSNVPSSDVSLNLKGTKKKCGIKPAAEQHLEEVLVSQPRVPLKPSNLEEKNSFENNEKQKEKRQRPRSYATQQRTDVSKEKRTKNKSNITRKDNRKMSRKKMRSQSLDFRAPKKTFSFDPADVSLAAIVSVSVGRAQVHTIARLRVAFYTVSVSVSSARVVKRSSVTSVTTSRRFNDFKQLRRSLMEEAPVVRLPRLPSKGTWWFWRNLTPSFLQQRQVALSTWLNDVLAAYRKAKYTKLPGELRKFLNLNDRSPLNVACFRGNEEAVRSLLAGGADVCGRKIYDCTPMHWACINGNPKIVEMLLMEGADSNALDMQGMTPLHFACQHGHLEAAKLLVAAGVDPSAKTNSNSTALDLARAGRYKKLAIYLSQVKRAAVKPGKPPWEVLKQGEDGNTSSIISVQQRGGLSNVRSISTATVIIEEENEDEDELDSDLSIISMNTNDSKRSSIGSISSLIGSFRNSLTLNRRSWVMGGGSGYDGNTKISL